MVKVHKVPAWVVRAWRDAYSEVVAEAGCPCCGGKLRAYQRSDWPEDGFVFKCCGCGDVTSGVVGILGAEGVPSGPQNGGRISGADKGVK